MNTTALLDLKFYQEIESLNKENTLFLIVSFEKEWRRVRN